MKAHADGPTACPICAGDEAFRAEGIYAYRHRRYADRFDGKIRAILSSAIKNDLVEVTTRRIERFLNQCLREFDAKFDPNFELREWRVATVAV